MSEHKKRERKLKGPDAFQVKAMSGLDYILHHKVILWGLGIVIVVIGGVLFGAKYFLEAKTESRREALAQVELQFDHELNDAQKLRDQLQKEVTDLKTQEAAAGLDKKPGTDAKQEKPSAQQTDPALAPKIADLEKKMAQIEPDHAKSSLMYQDYFKEHTDSPEGWYAGTRYANFLLDQEKPQEAKLVLEKILKEASGNKFYQTQARMMLVSTLEDMKDYDQALAQIELLTKGASAELEPKFMLAKGRLLAEKNQKEEAKTTFDALIKEHGSSPEAEKARSLKALIN